MLVLPPLFRRPEHCISARVSTEISAREPPDASLVQKVAPAREDHRHPAPVRRLYDLLVTPGAPWLYDGRDAGFGQRLHPVGEREEASLAATAPRVPWPAFLTASPEASTRLVCPPPIPTVAPSLASTIALLLTLFTTRQAKRRSSI